MRQSLENVRAHVEQSVKGDIPTLRLRSGVELPLLGLGTWGFGGREARDPSNDDTRDIRAIQRALEHGITHIDTAEAYAGGYAEELIGKALVGIPRERLVIGSKVHDAHLAYHSILGAAQASIDRLGCEYLDLYMLHGPSAQVGLAESFSALNELHSRGRIKSVGLSNFPLEKVREAEALSLAPLDFVQLHYNLSVREIVETGLLEYCQKAQIAVVAWRPLEKGKFSPEQVAFLKPLTDKYGCTVSQLAIAWLLRQEGVATIFQTRNEDHLRENLSALNIQIEDGDYCALRDQFPGTLSRSYSRPLS
ncbi:MAG: aldo/keto reductase [Bdellovibrionales bacterium]|nr:aldo/keto reductase [Bdellovibrionales bacterium]